MRQRGDSVAVRSNGVWTDIARDLIALLAASTIYDTALAGKQVKVYETRGTASIMAKATFTYGAERRNIEIPQYIDVSSNPTWADLNPDSDSGWTRCRKPLKNALSWQGVTERELVFECRPVEYFK